jgi:hypothetical protein
MAAPTAIPDELRDPDTPSEVEVTLQAPAPIADPTLGVELSRPIDGAARHRLVTLGDSLTHGFQSFAIFNTDLSYPALIASELGCYGSFLHPEYRRFGGLPLNLEYVTRELDARYGARPRWWELGSALFFLHHTLDQICEYWEQGPGSQVPAAPGIMHNLAVSGYDVRDLFTRTAETERARMNSLPPSLVHLVARNAGQLMGLYVLASAVDAHGHSLTPIGAARALGEDGGIETLTIFIGANNALRTMTDLRVAWSGPGYDTLDGKGAYTVWRPTHFAAELDLLVEQVKQVRARHVIWATVPHVTIVPIAHGVGEKMRPGSRYFPYYTHPWIPEGEFDPAVDPYVTGNQARAIDSAIDQYNQAIAAHVRAAREEERRDWLLLDTCGLMDRLASRRYAMDAAARPPWWTPYELPAAVRELDPPLDSRFFATGLHGRSAGGLFSLDGVHPTTVAYGLLAQEFINVMAGAGVVFPGRNGQPRQGPVQMDFRRLIPRDALISDPPAGVTPDLKLLGWANERLDWVRRMGRIFT